MRKIFSFLGRLKSAKGKIKKSFVVAGILHGSRAYVGPEVLHIDLTNECNNSCIACWCRSPLLENKAMPDWERKLTLPLDLLKNVFNDIASLGGLKQVKLVGGGEPFMHPHIFEVIKYIKNKDANIAIDINTNFSMVGENEVDRLFELGVDSLTVSLWAGSPGIYLATHPNQSEDVFQKIRKSLKYISKLKKEMGIGKPFIRIHNVIMNINYKDLNRMLEFGFDVGADAIQFVPVDPVKGKTDTLLLNDKEKDELLDNLYNINKLYNPKDFRYSLDDGNCIALSDFDGFIQRIERLNIKSGAYDEEKIGQMPCYVGWLFARIMTTGNVVPCCKGHKMVLGNVYKNSFRNIWNSKKYREFRSRAKNLKKSHAYFSVIGNDASSKTGCYNCDNLWQNEPMHKLILSLPIGNKISPSK